MPIEATQPTTIEATYPYWAFTFSTSGYPIAPPGGSVVDTVSCQVTMVKFRIREDGVAEQSPLPSDQDSFTVTDLYAAAAEKPSLATALAAVLEAIQVEAQAQGKL